MAVRIDADMLVASVGQHLAELGRQHVQQHRLRGLEAEDGGAGAIFTEADGGLLDVWVGVIDGELTGECDCSDDMSGDLCEHAVAVAFSALDKGLIFASIPARTEEKDPEERRFAAIAAELDPRELVGLVAEQAAADRYFAALLLSRAGKLTAPDADELDEIRELIADMPGGDYWTIVETGREILAELELLAVRPVIPESRALTDEAITAWGTLIGGQSGQELEEIGAGLAEIRTGLAD